MALQELPLPVVHLAQGSSREEKRSVALALLLVFTSFAKLFADIGAQEDVRRADLATLLATGAPSLP